MPNKKLFEALSGGSVRCPECGGQWSLLAKCGLCEGLGFVAKVPVRGQDYDRPETDVRLAIAEAFRERADQALREGDWYLHGIWNQAADIARDFIVRPGT